MITGKTKAIIDALKTQILKGKFDEGHPLPSERALMQRFGVARATASRALAELARMGLVERRPGSGTFPIPRSCMPLSDGAIGLFMPVSHCDIFVPICREIVRQAQDNGFTFMLADVTTIDVGWRARSAVQIAENLVRSQVRGVIFHPLQNLENSQDVNDSVLSIFDKARIPVVLADCDTVAFPQRSRYDVIGIDNVNAGYRMTRYLLSLGCRRIAFLTHPTLGASHRNRVVGYRLAMNEAKRNESVFSVANDSPAALRQLLNRHGMPEAILCSNDRMAMNLYEQLRLLGRRVPDDILVTGVDDCELAAALTPRLTTIHQPCEVIARTAFRLLCDRIQNPGLLPRTVYLDAPLIVRESTTRKTESTKSVRKRETLSTKRGER
ncbi:MAG: GntR family transcriptional regulator [Kiritimatiellae bacterium]|nr:GntR family transcriptional regulator [Kiritimatiellia bacterium]